MIPTLTTRAFDQPTATRVTLKSIDLVYSYDTLVAFRAPGEGWRVRENVWSNTTGRTLNAIDGGSKQAKAARLSQTDFNMLLEATAAAKG